MIRFLIFRSSRCACMACWARVLFPFLLSAYGFPAAIVWDSYRSACQRSDFLTSAKRKPIHIFSRYSMLYQDLHKTGHPLCWRLPSALPPVRGQKAVLRSHRADMAGHALGCAVALCDVVPALLYVHPQLGQLSWCLRPWWYGPTPGESKPSLPPSGGPPGRAGRIPRG